MLTVVSENFDPTNRIIYCELWTHVPCEFFNVVPPCIVIEPLHMTSKWSSWGTTSKFRRSTERIIDENSIIYKYKIKSETFYVHKLHFLWIIRSVERRNFQVVPQDGRFHVSARGLYCNYNAICPIVSSCPKLPPTNIFVSGSSRTPLRKRECQR